MIAGPILIPQYALAIAAFVLICAADIFYSKQPVTAPAESLGVRVSASLQYTLSAMQCVVIGAVFANNQVRRIVVPGIAVNVMHMCSRRQRLPERGFCDCARDAYTVPAVLYLEVALA